MQENETLNAVLESYDAEAFASLGNMERVRCFWRLTTMDEKVFKKMIINTLGKDANTRIDVFNDFTPENLKKLIANFIDHSTKTAKSSDKSEQYWIVVCKKIAKHNVETFLKSNDCDKVINDFSDELANFFRDEDLTFTLLLNFIRSIARKELVQTEPERDVNFKRGITERIWQKAAKKYFPEECVL